MKKLSCLAVAVALVMSSAAFAVQYDPECETAGMLDGEGAGIATILGVLGFFGPGVTVPWAEMDADGSGILDQWEFAMLAAVICAAPSGDVAGQFAANAGGFTEVVDALAACGEFLAAPNGHGALSGQCEAAGPIIIAWISQPGLAAAIDAMAGAGTSTQIMGLGMMLSEGNVPEPGDDPLSEMLDDFAGQIDDYVPLIFGTKEGWAAMAGMSTESKALVVGLFGDLLGPIADAAEDLPDLVEGLEQVLFIQTQLVGAYAPYAMSTANQAVLAMLAGDVGDLIPLLGPASTLPEIEIYGVTGKAAGEPFAAEGDYNGDGLTNKETYDATVGAGGDMASYVSNATGDDPFWSGNPNLPAVGLVGLAALIGSLALGGIARRK